VTRVRLLTYNVLMGGRRGRPLYDVVRAVAPDVLLVNESPKTPVLWGGRCRRLAERCELRYVAGGRPAGSNMLATASGVRVKASSAVVLPTSFRQPRRGIVSAQLRMAGRLFGVVGVHLSLEPDQRAGEVRRALQLAGELRGPVVLAGDLNEPPDGPSWTLLRRAGFTDHGTDRWPTFPADAPERRIDALLVRGRAQVLRHGDPGIDAALLAAASDHRPVLAELEL
jgi:endonuclease/exonuclease/phosphatase family metal-dependent hydrolase